MNQTCKVCGEPAAGFHFGAFTCEGCKSFFGRSFNNVTSISDCKNNGECVINKKNRTACKACRLRKCLMVGMSKSGSRYGRRSNWFKIHCLLQEQQQQQQSSGQSGSPVNFNPTFALSMLKHSSYKDSFSPMSDSMMDCDDQKRGVSPALSSPANSLISDSGSADYLMKKYKSPSTSDFLPFGFPNLPLMPPPHLFFPHPYQYQELLKSQQLHQQSHLFNRDPSLSKQHFIEALLSKKETTTTTSDEKSRTLQSSVKSDHLEQRQNLDDDEEDALMDNSLDVDGDDDENDDHVEEDLQKCDSIRKAEESSNNSPLDHQLLDEPLDLSVSKNGDTTAISSSQTKPPTTSGSPHLYSNCNYQKSSSTSASHQEEEKNREDDEEIVEKEDKFEAKKRRKEEREEEEAESGPEIETSNNGPHCLGQQQKQQSAFFEYFKKTFVGENQFLKIKNNEIYSF